jgi:hypothetical protein
MRSVALALLGLTLAASARDIAVSPGASLATARDEARAGDRIVLRGGIHRLDDTLRLGPGSSGVSWIAAPDEKPVLSGGIAVTGWKAGENGRFTAKVDLENFRQLWVNGTRAKRARGAAPAGLNFWGKNEAGVETYDNPPGLTGTPGYKPGKLKDIAPAGYTTTDASLAGWKNVDDLEMGFFSSWSHKIARVAKITRHDGGAIIEMAQPGFFLCNRAGGAVARMPAYLENALELLDEPGEWYFDRPSRTLYYLPRPGEDMTTAEVIAPRLETLLEVKGAHDVRFEGLTFAHATWLRPSTALAHPEVQANCIASMDNGYFRPEHEKGWVPVNGEHVKCPANVVVDACRGIRFEGCTFTALGGAGLDLQNGSQSNVVSGCRFEDIAANGIQVGGLTREDHHPSTPERVVKDNRIENNVITRTGQDYTSGIGVFAGYTEGTVIAHNEILEVPYSGISIGWGWGMPDAGGGAYVDPIKWNTPTAARNNRIEHNHIHHMMQRLNDGAGVYTLGRQPGTVIRANHIHDGGKSQLSGGVYLDEGSADIEVTGNLIYHMPRPLMFNNHKQNRRASCTVEGNLHTPPAGPAPGVKGKALRGGSGIDTPVDADPPQFTVTAWVRLERYPEGPDARRWIVCRTAHEHTDRNISLFVDTNSICAYLNIGGGPANCFEAKGAGEALPLNAWTQVALTYDGDALRVYRDAKEVGATRIGRPRVPGTAPLTIGARSDRFSAFDVGDIDEVRLFDRALTPAELVKADETAEGLVKHWDFEHSAEQDAAAKIAAAAGLQSPYRRVPE